MKNVRVGLTSANSIKSSNDGGRVDVCVCVYVFICVLFVGVGEGVLEIFCLALIFFFCSENQSSE